MNKRINIGKKDKALKDLEHFCLKHYESVDVEFFNVHLKELNKVCCFNLFSKNSLFVRSSTLWELMQPEGKIGNHHFHGLSVLEIFGTIKGIACPVCIYESYLSRYVVVTTCQNKRNENIIVVIETNASLANNRSANVNKIVSIYPKKNIENVIKKIDKNKILFIK